MVLSLANNSATPPPSPSTAAPAAGSATPPLAPERADATGPLQPRAGGSGAGVAPRQSLQVLRPEGQVAAGAASTAGGHVIDIGPPDAQPAGAGAWQAGVASSRQGWNTGLPAVAALSGMAATASFLSSCYVPEDTGERQGLRTMGFASASAGAVAFGTWLAMTWRARRAATPAETPEQPLPLDYRQPYLLRQPLAWEVAKWGHLRGTLGPAAKQFDWNAPNLFVDGAGANQTREVSHLLKRALLECRRSDHPFAASLGAFLDQLATRPELRTDLADLAVDANGQCQDRIGIRLGELLLTQALRDVRDPAAAPRDVVLTLALHAATQAMKTQIANRLGRRAVPSADLLLAGFHAVQSTLQQHGIAVPTMFPEEDERDESDLLALRGSIGLDALEIVQCYGLQSADGAGSSQVGAAAAVDRGTGLATLLRLHGGKAYDDILAVRLAHLREPVLAEWHEKDGAAAAVEGYWPALDRAYGKAIAGALSGDLGEWVSPAASSIRLSR